MTTKENFAKAVEELRKEESKNPKQRKFDQTVDFIINLKEFDVRKYALNSIITLPHKIKEKKIAGFLEKKSKVIFSITKQEFPVYSKDPKVLKELIESYDFFIANAKLMPAVATTFGRLLGPAGKMPSPQLGILIKEEDSDIKELSEKINSVIKIRQKEPSVKVSIGKQSMKDEDIVDNAVAVYNEVFKSLPRQKENLKSILIKFTMSEPVKVKL